MSALLRDWPLMLIVAMFLGMVILLAVRWTSKKEKCEPTPLPDDLVEKIARAMCRADGRNPDGDGSVREWYSDGSPGRYKWMLYKDQARRYLAAQAVFFNEVMREIREPEASEEPASSES